MSRWEPDARRRLQQAALRLFAAHGYGETTVAAIAAEAGLTERTFFRHFDDKREVLFADDARLLGVLIDAVASAAAEAPPRAALEAGFTALAAVLDRRRAAARRRMRLVLQHPELLERELAKLTGWTAALEQALRDRGLDAQRSKAGAAVAIALFRVAYQRWTGARSGSDLTALLHETGGALEDLAGPARRR